MASAEIQKLENSPIPNFINLLSLANLIAQGRRILGINKIFQSQRFKFLPSNLSDITLFYTWYNKNPQLYQYLFSNRPSEINLWSIQDHFIQSLQGESGELWLSIRDKSKSAILGSVKIETKNDLSRDVDYTKQKIAELTIFLSPEIIKLRYTKGIGTEALREVLKYLSQEDDYHNLTCE